MKDDKVFVFNEKTGEERHMGTDQFARVKKNGWVIIPETSKPKAETGNDTAKSNSTTEKTGVSNEVTEDSIDEILKDNAKGVVITIKKLASANEFDTIKAIGEREAKSKDPRSTVTSAVEKLLNPK